MAMVPEPTCIYKPTGEKGIVRSSCTPGREWIPQEDMIFCPFCSRPIRRAPIEKKEIAA